MSISQQQRVASPTTANARAREEQALELRRAGCSYREIATALRTNPGAAHKLVKRAVDRQLARVSDLAAEVQHIELDRLDRMFRGIWPQASQGNFQAIDRALRIMERRASLLGTDAPKKFAPTTPDGDTLPAGTLGVLAIPATLSPEAWQQLAQQHSAPPPPR